MNSQKIIGLLLIVGAVGVLIPYTALTIIFDYPDVLRLEAGLILTKFHQGGAMLIWVWWAFAILGLPLLWSYVLIGQQFEQKVPYVRWATTLGVISGVTQIIGLLRWTFVVPTLASAYAGATTEATREATKVVFLAMHQFGGALLGEHIGQLFTIAWTVMMARAFTTLGIIPNWIAWFGYVASGIYLLAQAELFATVIPTFPVWGFAGFIGSTLWLVWLILVGVKMLRTKFA